MTSNILSKLPSVLVDPDFLEAEDHARLLDEALASEDEYKPSLIGHYDNGREDSGGRVNKTVRQSAARRLPKEFAAIFKARVLEDADKIARQIGVAFPEERKFEIEAVHSGDGAFFATHYDTNRGPLTSRRVISAVYYYCKAPKQFSGGGLRLYSLDQSASMTVEPNDNTVVFFPSMFPHEVLPVSLPSNTFEDGRFSVNCWIHKLV